MSLPQFRHEETEAQSRAVNGRAGLLAPWASRPSGQAHSCQRSESRSLAARPPPSTLFSCPPMCVASEGFGEQLLSMNMSTHAL